MHLYFQVIQSLLCQRLCRGLCSVRLQAGLLEYSGEVAEHQLAGNGEHDDAEELTDDVQRCLSQVFGKPVRTDKHQIKGHDTQDQGDTETGDAILRRDRQQGRERTRTGIHRESQGYDRALALQQIAILEDRDIQNHLQRHEEDHKPAGNSEILYLHAEELEDPFAQEKECHENNQTRQADTPGHNPNSLLLHRNRHRDISKRIDDGNEKNKGRNNLPKIYRTKEILYRFHSIRTIKFIFGVQNY